MIASRTRMRAYTAHTFTNCLLHVHTYMHLAVHHRVTHGWHVPTITMDTTICTPSYRKIKVVGSQAFARFQVPSSLPVRYAVRTVRFSRKAVSGPVPSSYTNIAKKKERRKEKERRDKSGFLIPMLPGSMSPDG